MSLVGRVLANIGLQKRILLSVAAGLGIALGGFSLLSLHLMSESTDRILGEQLAVAQVSAANVDRLLRDVSDQLQVVAARQSTALAAGSEREEQMALADAYGLMHSFISRLMLIDRSGRVLLVVPADDGTIGLDYSSRPHVQRTLATGLPAVAASFGSVQGGRPGIAITAPVRDRDGNVIRLISGEIDFAQRGVGDFLQPIKVGKTGYLQLVDENGLVLATTEPPGSRSARTGPASTFTTHPEHFPTLIREGQPVVRVCHTCHQTAGGLERGRDIMAFAPLSAAPFGMALRLTEEDVFATSYKLQWAVLIYSLAVLAFGLLFAWLTTNAVVRPLEALTSAARRIGGGDLDSPAQLPGGPGTSETTTLAATFEAMRRRLSASYDRIERMNRDLEDRVAQRTRELSILFEVSQTLTRTVDVDALMQMVVEKIVSAVEAADAALLFRYDPEREELTPRAAVGYHSASLAEVHLKSGEAMAGQVLEAGRPLLFADSAEVGAALATLSPANAVALRRAREGLAQPQAALGAPIVYEGDIAGVLLLVNLRQQGTFDPSDVALVQALADQVAVAIEHARLVQEASQVQALREADRLKSEFLYNVSHELRTPLSSIVSLVEVLAADYRTIPRRQLGQVLAILERSAARLKDMVENLLDAGSIQAGRFRIQPQPDALAEIVRDALVCVQPLLDAKDQTVDVSLPEHDLDVFVDHHRIVQVLVNLISNANKYCPAGQRFHLSAERQNGWVSVSLADSGPGIPPEDQAHLFERFYRSARPLSVSGAGLGLAIVKAIIEAHGGCLSLESRVGTGTTVSFTVPLVAPEPPLTDFPVESDILIKKRTLS